MGKGKKPLDSAAKDALARFKYEIAGEINDAKIKSRPTLGAYMVEQMLKAQEGKMDHEKKECQ